MLFSKREKHYSSLSLTFPPSLRNKFKTKVFPVHLKTILVVALSELKIWDFHHYVQERVLFLQKHSHSLKLQNIFSGARNSVHALAATSSEICTMQRRKNMNG